MADDLFDPGLQPERTKLAWRRTALGIGVGSLIALRVLPLIVPQPLCFAPGLVGFIFALLIWRRSRTRYLTTIGALAAKGSRRLPGAVLLLHLTIFVLGFGVFSAATVFWVWLR